MGLAPGYPRLIVVVLVFFASDLVAGPQDGARKPIRAALARLRSHVMFITEIFKSIQGEGTRAGLPCIFVRLTGCNLRCTWCDTAYAFHGGKKMSVEEVLARVDELAGRRRWAHGIRPPLCRWWS